MLDAKLVHCQKKKLAVQLQHAVENIIRYYDQCIEYYSHQAKKETAGHAATRHWKAVGHRVLHVFHGLAPLEPYVTQKVSTALNKFILHHQNKLTIKKNRSKPRAKLLHR